MDEEWYRKMLIEAHHNQRAHMERILAGLTKNHFLKKVTSEERLHNILGIVWHIASAETYWFHKSGHSIGPKFEAEDIEVIQTGNLRDLCHPVRALHPADE